MSPRSHSAEETVERDGEEIPVLLEIEWRHSEGVYLEPGHSRNGYGKGWYCKDITAHDSRGALVELTEREIDTFQERYSAERIRDLSQ